MTTKFKNKTEDRVLYIYAAALVVVHYFITRFVLIAIEINILMLGILILVYIFLIRYFNVRKAIEIETISWDDDIIELFHFKQSKSIIRNCNEIEWQIEAVKTMIFQKSDHKLLGILVHKQCLDKDHMLKLHEKITLSKKEIKENNFGNNDK